MLAIHRRLFDRLRNVKAITAGTVAFGVGLTGAAAYVGSGLVYDNFSYEAADPKASAKVAGASTTAEIKAENGESGMPGSGSSGSSTPVMGQSATTGVSVAPSAGSISTTPVVGGMGAGPTPTVTVSPTPTTQDPVQVVPTDPETCLCGLLDTADGTVDRVDSTVDSAVDRLGL